MNRRRVLADRITPEVVALGAGQAAVLAGMGTLGRSR